MTAATQIPIRPLLVVNFIGTMGFSIVLPFLVFLVDRWGGNALVYGVVGATYSAFQLIGAPILGRWSDTQGRKKILLLSQLGTLASWGIFLLAFALPVTPLWQLESGLLGSFVLTLPLLVLFVSRALDGLTGGNISVANAYLADISTDANRNVNFGKMAISANLGFIVGPALAALLGGTAWGELLPVLAAFCISLVASGLIWRTLPESKPCLDAPHPDKQGLHRVMGQEYKECVEEPVTQPLGFTAMLRLPGIAVLLAIYFLVMLAFNFFYVAFPVQAVRNLEWSVQETGVFFAVLSLMMALVQGPVLQRAVRVASDATLAALGSAILVISFPLLSSTSWVPLHAGVLLLALGNGLMWPSVVALLSRQAGPTYQGAVQGVAGSCGAVASIVGLVVGGALFDSYGARIFLVSAVLLFLVFLLCLRMMRWRLPGAPEAVAET